MNFELYTQVQQLISIRQDFSRIDLYYIGFSSYFIQSLTLEKLCKHVESLNQAFKQDLMTSSEKMDLLIDILWNALNNTKEIIVTKEGGTETEKEILNSYFSQIAEILSRFESISKFEAFYIGRFHALLPSYRIAKLFHHMKNLNELEMKGSLSETKKIDLLMNMFNHKINNRGEKENILNLPNENNNLLLNSVQSKISGVSEICNAGEKIIVEDFVDGQEKQEKSFLEEENDDDSSDSSPKYNNSFSYQRASLNSNILHILNKYLPATKPAVSNQNHEIQIESEEFPIPKSPSVNANNFKEGSQEFERTASIRTQKIETSDQHSSVDEFIEGEEEEEKQDVVKESDFLKSMNSIDKFFKPSMMISSNGRHSIELDDIEILKDLEFSSRRSLVHNNNQKKICLICKESVENKDASFLQNCACVFHANCLSRYVMTYLRNDIDEIKCPKARCSNKVLLFDLIDIVDDSALEKFVQLTITKHFDRNKAFICCPTAGCPFAFVQKDQSRFSCPLCKSKYCMSCLQRWHLNNFCELEGNCKFKRFKICPCCGESIEFDYQNPSHILQCKQGSLFCWKCGENSESSTDHSHHEDQHRIKTIIPPGLFHQSLFKTIFLLILFL